MSPSSSSIYVFALISILGLQPALGQISISTSTLTPPQLFDAVFGLTNSIANLTVQITGSSDAIGIFENATDIGLTSGVALSTGAAVNGVGPNTSPSTTTGFSLPGDPSLPNSNDAVSVVFDFVAEEPVVFGIKYVFASEEYNEYLQYEDPFRFFVDGVNIALAADGQAVSVGTVNCGSSGSGSGPNCEQFINNEDASTFIEFDGYTVVMVATSEELPAGPHSIKLTIADVLDTAYDSCVFIEGNAVIVPTEEFEKIDFENLNPSPPPLASVLSDPHIQGFRGQHFEFTGEVGNAYAFISTPGLQMNAIVQEAYTSGLSVASADPISGEDDSGIVMQSFHQQGTWVTDIGIVVKASDGLSLKKIAVHASPEEDKVPNDIVNPFDISYGSVEVDETTPVTRIGEYNLDEGLSIEISNSKSFSRVSVTSKTPVFSIDIDIVSPPWKKSEINDDLQYAKLWHLNFHIKKIKFQTKDSLHGVLGQTMDQSTETYEGQESDYLVADGLLGHDFKYDKFDASYFTRGAKGRSVEHGSSGITKTGAGVPMMTYSEFLDILNLDMSLESLLETPNEEIAKIFHAEWEVLAAVLNNFSLASATALIQSGSSTPFDALHNFIQEFIYQCQITHNTDLSDYVAVRDVVQRLQVALDNVI